MRDRFTVIFGLAIAALGIVWIVDIATDVTVPWEYVVPASIVVIGLMLVVLRSDGGSGGAPPSQFERDDAPRVP